MDYCRRTDDILFSSTQKICLVLHLPENSQGISTPPQRIQGGQNTYMSINLAPGRDNKSLIAEMPATPHSSDRFRHQCFTSSCNDLRRFSKMAAQPARYLLGL